MSWSGFYHCSVRSRYTSIKKLGGRWRRVGVYIKLQERFLYGTYNIFFNLRCQYQKLELPETKTSNERHLYADEKKEPKAFSLCSCGNHCGFYQDRPVGLQGKLNSVQFSPTESKEQKARLTLKVWSVAARSGTATEVPNRSFLSMHS